MKRRRVAYAPEAVQDLTALNDWIADAASEAVADRFVDRLQVWLDSFEMASERGTRRDDVRPGLRTIGYERRLTVAFAVDDETVTILRVFYGGQDWVRTLSGE